MKNISVKSVNQSFIIKTICNINYIYCNFMVCVKR